MKGLKMGKLLAIFVRIILPDRVASAILNRIERTKRALTSTKEMRIFLKIVFLPVELLISFFIAIIKIVAIWTMPTDIYNNLKFVFNQFYDDLNVKKIGFGLAWKRVKLCWELFTKGKERKVSFGEKNPDKVFYVIRPYYFLERNELISNVSNLLVHYYRNLQHLSWAIEHGWIPVVDWENYGPFPHGEDYPINGTLNKWEYYWNQPSNYSLEEVYQSKNVILSVQNTRDTEYMPSAFFKNPLQKQAEDYVRRCPKYDQLITLNNYTSEYVNEKQLMLFPDEARILGVSIRGTSYGVESSHTETSGHPIQPSVGKLIESIKIAMDEWNMDYIFIACELDTVINHIKETFGEKVLVLPRLRYSTSPKRGDVEKGLDPLYLPGRKYQTNLDYVTEMVLLSRCNSLLAAMSSGVRCALIWNKNQYENIKIFENGLW